MRASFLMSINNSITLFKVSLFSRLERMHTSKKPIRVGKSVEKEYRKGKLGGVSKKIGGTLFD